MKLEDLKIGHSYIVMNVSEIAIWSHKRASKINIIEITENTVLIRLCDSGQKERLLKDKFDEAYEIIEDLGNSKEEGFQQLLKEMNKAYIQLENTPENLSDRAYFSGLAMQGYCGGEFTGQAGMSFESMAKFSVSMADALIKELNKAN